MSVLAVVPARLGATRLPRKPLRLLGGEPLIVRVWQNVVAMTVADEVVVATDSAEVVQAVERAGGRAVMTRADHPSGTDRVAEVATLAEFAGYDVIVNVQGDEPFADERPVKAAVAMVRDRGFFVGTAACRTSTDALSDANVVKVVCDDDGRALYFSRAAIPHLRDTQDEGDRAAREQLVRQHIGIYVYTREALARWVILPPHPLEQVERLEQLRPLAAGMSIGVADAEPPAVGGIDTERDLERANAHWGDLYAGRS